jgi:hypothetical protein
MSNLTLHEKKDFIINIINKNKCNTHNVCRDIMNCSKIHTLTYSDICNCVRIIYFQLCRYNDRCHRYEKKQCNYFHSNQILDWYDIYVKTQNEKLLCNTIINYLNDSFDNMVIYKRNQIRKQERISENGFVELMSVKT